MLCSSVVKKITSEDWEYTLTMKAYTDSGRKNLITKDTEIQLNQKIFVELKADGLDDKLVAVVTDSCKADNMDDTTSSDYVSHELITDK